MDIRSYLAAVERTYKFRIKTVFPMDDEVMTMIERTLLKYMPRKIGQPKKTMFQSNPLDFPTVQNAEVFLLDVELGLPASPYVVQKEIVYALHCPDKFVVVRGENEPGMVYDEEIETEKSIKDAANEKGLKAGAILLQDQYQEHDAGKAQDLVGQGAVSRFLGYVEAIEDEKKKAREVKDRSPLFAFMRDPADDPGPTQDPQDFNAHIAGAPGSAKADKAAPYDPNTMSRVFVDKDGKSVILTQQVKRRDA